MKVGAGLELLGEAMTRAGIPLWHAPESVDAIDALAAAVAPMRLPSDVVEFWRRVDVGTMRVEPHPRFSPPDFALRSWQSAEREFIAFQPLTMVLVGYESHTCT
jgi:hypothetical protein